MELDQSIMTSERFKLVLSSFEGIASLTGKFLCNHAVKSHVGVQTSAHCSASLSQLRNFVNLALDTLDAFFHLFHVSRELLTQCQWRGVLGVCSADFNDMIKGFLFLF